MSVPIHFLDYDLYLRNKALHRKSYDIPDVCCSLSLHCLYEKRNFVITFCPYTQKYSFTHKDMWLIWSKYWSRIRPLQKKNLKRTQVFSKSGSDLYIQNRPANTEPNLLIFERIFQGFWSTTRLRRDGAPSARTYLRILHTMDS